MGGGGGCWKVTLWLNTIDLANIIILNNRVRVRLGLGLGLGLVF